MKVINANVVVLASEHNPTILHPFFLRSQNIVPSDWEEIGSETFCTPAFSKVAFRNGVVFNVQRNRLQVVNSNATETLHLTPDLDALCINYLRTLPHVTYNAIGINITGFNEIAHADTYLRARFLRQGPWSTDDLELETLQLRFGYPVQGGRLSLSVAAATASDLDKETPIAKGVVSEANFHYELAQGTSLEVAERRLKAYSDHFPRFTTIVRKVVLDETP